MAKSPKPALPPFPGFERPEANWFRMPNSWTDMTADISSIAELKVVEYILRHTWGYSEYGLKKHITIDEFVKGRHRQDGGRLDRGTGLSERAVYDGLRKAVEDGLIEEEIDDSDRGRVKKWYCLRMRDDGENARNDGLLQSLQPGVQSLQGGVQSLQGGVQSLQGRGAKFAPRSEKDTLERQDEERNSNTRMAPRQVLTGHELNDDTDERMLLGEALIRRSVAHDLVEASSPGARQRPTRPMRTIHQDQDYQVIQAYIADFAREFNDRASLRVSTVRAYNLFKRSGLTRQAFLDQLYAARTVVKERTPQIRNTGEAGSLGTPVKHRVAYYFAVLEDLLGLREDRTDEVSGSSDSASVPGDAS